jgi:thiamine-phosphate pyrophosphorylase
MGTGGTVELKTPMKPVSDCRLYGIIDTGYVPAEKLSRMTELLIQGGIDILQLRAKKQSRDEIRIMARELAPICQHAGIAFILNDYPDLVAETGADGAHVGQDDMSVSEARRLAGKEAIIGKSTHSLEQARASMEEFPDYIGFGPLFATATKPDYTPIGMEHIFHVRHLVPYPVFCIGGITLTNLPKVIQAGADRVVIVSDLLTSADPLAKASSCKALLQS